MTNTQLLLCETIQNLGIEFWIPILVTIGLAIWNLFQQIRLEDLKKEKEKQLHVHRLQFEKEFGIYNDLWTNLVDLRAIIALLRPELDSTEPGKTYEETIQARIVRALEIGNMTIDTIERNKPFYAKAIYDELGKIIKLIKTEIIEVRHGDRLTKKYWEDGQKNLNELVQLTDNVCEAIRNRIGNLETK